MGSLKIIVVDDEVMVADLSRMALTHSGYLVSCAHSGEQAIEMAMETAFDLAVIDAMLPGINGMETFEGLQLISPSLQGVLVSGDLTVEMVIEAVEKGFSRTLTKPLQPLSLVQAVQAALNKTVIQKENTELKKQVKQMRNLIEHYMAPEVAAILLNRQELNPRMRGAMRPLTILFADIRNFSFLAQRIPVTELRDFLTEFFDMVADVVSSWQGILDKFMGDAALAVFGAPVPQGHANLSAVSAAIDIQKKFEDLRKQWAFRFEPFLEIGLGIGISSGNVYQGNIGSSRRLDFTVLGAEVNIAQRLASDTTGSQILMTETVYHEVADTITAREEKEKKLRGIQEKIKTYSIKALAQ
jgi:class 3 adenylate cyclase/CheY-like chemotaxis protein